MTISENLFLCESSVLWLDWFGRAEGFRVRALGKVH